MFTIIVTEKGGDQRRHEFDKNEVTIGRVQGNDIILPKGNVSKRHARIVLKDGKFIIVDLKSTNGTYVNGRKITSPLVVKENDKIYIGDFILGVDESGAAAAAEPEAPMVAEPEPEPAPAPPSPPSPPAPVAAPPSPAPAPPAPAPPAPSPPPPTRTAPPRRPPPPTSAPPPLREDAPLAAPEPPAPVAADPVPPPPEPMAAPEPPAPEPPSAPAPAAPAPTAPPLARPVSSLGRAESRPKPRLVGAGASRAKVRPLSSDRGATVAPLEPRVSKLLELQADIHDRVAASLELADMPTEAFVDDELWERAEAEITRVVGELDASGDVPNFIDQELLVKETLNEALGLGPLEDLMVDDAVEEILVDRFDRLVVRREGQLQGSGRAFSSPEIFRRVVERLVATSGERIDESHPIAHVRLRDGSRLSAAISPVAVHAACVTLRKASAQQHSLASLIDSGALSGEMGDFLTTCIAARVNVLVCGAPGPGKTGILSALAAASPDGERVVSVEEVAEISMDRDAWVALEARPGDANGIRPIGVDTLLRSALRLMPDRLVVGEVRGTEAFELLQAMVAGDGVVASTSGESAGAALSRLTAMARMASPELGDTGLRSLVASAAPVVVTVRHYADGSDRIASIAEVVGASTDEGFRTRELFSFAGGSFEGMGVVPGFYADLEARGVPADTSIFS